jgi:hypothetical protein
MGDVFAGCGIDFLVPVQNSMVFKFKIQCFSNLNFEILKIDFLKIFNFEYCQF